MTPTDLLTAAPAPDLATAPTAASLRARLEDLEGAEDFFIALGVSYDPRWLAARRLPILATYRRLLDGAEDGAAQHDAAALLACHRRCLAQAYIECCDAATQDTAGLPKTMQKRKPAFVGLGSIAPLDSGKEKSFTPDEEVVR